MAYRARHRRHFARVRVRLYRARETLGKIFRRVYGAQRQAVFGDRGNLLGHENRPHIRHGKVHAGSACRRKRQDTALGRQGLRHRRIARTAHDFRHAPVVRGGVPYRRLCGVYRRGRHRRRGGVRRNVRAAARISVRLDSQLARHVPAHAHVGKAYLRHARTARSGSVDGCATALHSST